MFRKPPQVRQLVSEYTPDQVYDFVLAHAQEHLGLKKMFVKQRNHDPSCWQLLTFSYHAPF